MTANAPILPWRYNGEINFRGWDLPLKWGIDSNNNAWRNYAHGDDIHCPTSLEDLLSLCDNDIKARDTLFEAFGIPDSLEKKIQSLIKEYGLRRVVKSVQRQVCRIERSETWFG